VMRRFLAAGMGTPLFQENIIPNRDGKVWYQNYTRG
jgi:hypothetical protein